ncbi:MAG: peptide-methionine (S)-S-oxide reductase MsrA [Crocinitomix sp.]|nr:peptide-methionine (S)-S-oxide reductase MsrA [Crocinitomix sp.]
MIKNILIATFSLFTMALVLISCQSATDLGATSDGEKQNYDNMQRAYFASGCFWCVEAIYESVEGVEEVYNGYAGGHTENPTYEASNTGSTGHAEAVEVIYDSTKVSFKQLVDVYFGSQNIEQVNGQGNDIGSQYRSIAFYSNIAEKTIIDQKVAALTVQGLNVASEIKSFEKFWMGEDYHQDYERLHPDQGYILAVSVPRLNRFKKAFPELLKKSEH